MEGRRRRKRREKDCERRYPASSGFGHIFSRATLRSLRGRRRERESSSGYSAFDCRLKFTIGELSITVRPRVRTSQSTNTRREFEGTRVQIVRKEKEKEDKLSCSKFHVTLLITRKFLLSGIFLLCKNPAAHERS